MAHTTHSLPNTVYYLNGTNDLDFTGDGVRTRVYAITNLGSAATTVDLTGDIYTYQTDDYKPLTTELASVALPVGATIYGTFSKVGAAAAGVVCYVK